MPPRRATPHRKRLGCLPLGGIAAFLFLALLVLAGSAGHSASGNAGRDPSAPIPNPPGRQTDLPPGIPGQGKPASDHQARITGKVVGIADGDTITLLSPTNEQIKIRLEGIDAPESSQEYGAKSKQALSALIGGKTITAAITGKDRYGRSLAWLESEGKRINRQMVADGWAWQYLQYNQDPAFSKLQADAKAQRLGLWAAPNAPMPPWEFRALGRSSSPAAPAAPSSSPQPQKPSSGSAKYWINSNGVRHNASCRWFGNTKSGHFSNTQEGHPCGMCGG